MKTKKAVALCAALGVAVAGLALATPANADPVSNSYVLVGSDTLQDAGNALANGTVITGSTVRTTGGGLTIGSFDAFGSAAIQTKSAGTYFARPAGSGDGVKALSRSIDGAPFSVSGNTTPAVSIAGQVDIARSSSGPGAAANASGPLAYVPFGRDAVTYAYKGTAKVGVLTGDQLKQAYECTLRTVDGVTLKPVLPQASSGTRKFFLSAIGSPALGDCVSQTSLPENDGSVLSEDGQIIPMSAASWIAQKNGAALNRTGSALLGSINNVPAATGSGSALLPNSPFYLSDTFGRDTYIVVENARIDDRNAKFDAGLFELVDPEQATSLSNFSSGASTAGAVKKKYGFLAPKNANTVRANLSS